MGTDIHWLMERKCADGRWRPICTNSLAFKVISEANNGDFMAYYDHPAAAARSRSYGVFAMLADVRNPYSRPKQLLYEQELPSDLSDVARAWLLEDTDLHSLGWASQKRIKEWDVSWSGWKLQDGEKKELSSALSSFQEAYLQIPSLEILNQHILHLPLYTDHWEPDFGIFSSSAHTRMDDRLVLKNMPAPTDDNVRFFFGFDN